MGCGNIEGENKEGFEKDQKDSASDLNCNLELGLCTYAYMHMYIYALTQ